MGVILGGCPQGVSLRRARWHPFTIKSSKKFGGVVDICSHFRTASVRTVSVSKYVSKLEYFQRGSRQPVTIRRGQQRRQPECITNPCRIRRNRSVTTLKTCLKNIFAERCYASAAIAVNHAVSVRLCVRMSVTFVDCVKTNKRIFKIVFTVG